MATHVADSGMWLNNTQRIVAWQQWLRGRTTVLQVHCPFCFSMILKMQTNRQVFRNEGRGLNF
jgi:hypothetical protein